MTGRNKANALSVSFSEQKVVPITTKKKEPSTHRRAYHAALPQLLFMAIPYYSDARVPLPVDYTNKKIVVFDRFTGHPWNESN